MLIKKIFKYEISAGLLLLISFIFAVVISNTNLYPYYLKLVYLPLTIKIGNLHSETIFLCFVNDALMSIFFLLVGLELKYHFIHGEFKERQKLILPLAAAIGGCIMPILIYFYFNQNKPTVNGWAIAIATDTAMVLGVLAFFNRKISNDLRAFILGFSLLDDIIAVILLAVFYNSGLNSLALFASCGLIFILFILNYLAIKNFRVYLAIGFLLWIAIVECGIHGTIAGIILAFFIPLSEKHEDVIAFNKFEQGLNPLVNWIILPVFIFINSEMPFKDITLQNFSSDLGIGIILGLFLGKQAGISLASFFVIKLRWCTLPKHTTWLVYYAISILGGIGFTFSIFIGSIAFYDKTLMNIMRTSIVAGSLLSAIIGSMLLTIALKSKHQTISHSENSA